MIVNLSIECKDDVTVLADHWLVTPGQIDDLQPDGSERHVVRLKYALLIWATMDQRTDCAANVAGT